MIPNGGIGMAKISVIVPVYNTAPFLDRCFSSLESQTVNDIEFILVDDKSTDGSLNIIEEYQSKDSRFKIISLPENEGVSVARNKGIEASTGKYIGFVDSDDFVDDNYYEKLSGIIDQTKVPIVVSKNIWDKGLQNGLIDFREQDRKIIEGGPSTCCHLLTRELIGEDRFIEHCRFEDSAFTYLMRMKSKEMFATNQVKYHYCIDNENSFNDITWNSSQSVLDLLHITEFLEQKVKMNPSFHTYKDQIEKIGIDYIFTIADILPEIATSFEECCDLMSHLEVMMGKKYEKSTREISSINMGTFDNYSNPDYQLPYLSMSKDMCEEKFKSKIKTLL